MEVLEEASTDPTSSDKKITCLILEIVEFSASIEYFRKLPDPKSLTLLP